MRPTYTRVRSLLGAVAFVAVSVAALRDASPLWASVVFNTIVATLGFAVLAAICRRGPARAWWVGFGVCGWIVLAPVCGRWAKDHLAARLVTTRYLRALHNKLAPPPLTDSSFSQFMKEMTGEMIKCIEEGYREDAAFLASELYKDLPYLAPEDRATLFAHRDLLDPKQQTTFAASTVRLPKPFWMGPPEWGSEDDFLEICQSLSALLAAYIGGLGARALYLCLEPVTKPVRTRV